MYADKDDQGLISIMEMTPEEAEIIQIGVNRVLNDLVPDKQQAFKRLLIQLEKIAPIPE